MATHRHFSERDSGYRATHFVELQAIVAPIQIVVTTPSTGSYWMAFDVSAHTTVLMAIKEGVTIDAAGSALVFRNRNRQKEDDCACLVEQGGTYSGGTTIFEKVDLRGEPGVHMLLKQSTCYQITVTTKANDNYTSCLLWVWQGSGAG